MWFVWPFTMRNREENSQRVSQGRRVDRRGTETLQPDAATEVRLLTPNGGSLERFTLNTPAVTPTPGSNRSSFCSVSKCEICR